MCLASKGSVSWASAAREPPSEMRYSTRPHCACEISQSPWTSCCPPCHSKSDWPKVFIGRLRRCVNQDRKSTRLNSSHLVISYAVFCLKKKNHILTHMRAFSRRRTD